MPHRIIIDTDSGIDDALAFLLALASPEIQLEALTTTQGSVTVDKATRNALSVLELTRSSHIPVTQGSVVPLIQTLLAGDARVCLPHFGRSSLRKCLKSLFWALPDCQIWQFPTSFTRV